MICLLYHYFLLQTGCIYAVQSERSVHHGGISFQVEINELIYDPTDTNGVLTLLDRYPISENVMAKSLYATKNSILSVCFQLFYSRSYAIN